MNQKNPHEVCFKQKLNLNFSVSMVSLLANE